MNTCSMLDAIRPARWLGAAVLALAMACAAPFAVAQPATNDLESLRQRAQAGDAEAQYVLAGKLHRGDGVVRDDVEARALVLKAAKQGHLDAQRSLGLYYWRSYGGPQDKVEAFKWILVAERGGNKDAANVRAYMLKSMSPEQVKEAQARADGEPGDAAAQRLLATRYLTGRGVPQDLARAEEWLRKSAAQGDEQARQMLQQMPVLYALAEATRLQPAGNVESVRKNAEAGDASAQFQLSRYYAEGVGVPKDKQLEVEWERKAAEQDHVEALGSRGIRLMLTHDGVQGDFWKGYGLLYRCGALGHPQAQRLLALLYQQGKGVRKDLVMSLIWLDVAVMAGDVRAKLLREDVVKAATPEQVAEANRRAVAWMKRPARERATPEGAP